MHELSVSISWLHIQGLQATLTAALGDKAFAATNGGDVVPTLEPVRLIMSDNAQPADDATAESVVAAHDPVFLSVDKAAIQANGTDVATITIRAPKAGAAPVVLTITITSPNGNVTSQDDPITLTNGVGTEPITALDPCTITVTVKNPTNRSTDTLTITAR